MTVLRIFENNINEQHIDRAVQALRNGEIIIYPTDSLYALGVDALNKKAVESLCALKGLNPDKNLLSIVCSDLSQASEYVRIDNNAFAILKENLPGPTTFVLPASTRLPKIFKNRKTVGLRIPGNAISRILAENLGNPLLTTSVEVDPIDPEASTEAENLSLTYSGRVALTIDGGSGSLNPTRVIDITDSSDPVILRN